MHRVQQPCKQSHARHAFSEVWQSSVVCVSQRGVESPSPESCHAWDQETRQKTNRNGTEQQQYRGTIYVSKREMPHNEGKMWSGKISYIVHARDAGARRYHHHQTTI